jgi:hypothetical protein|tara:strand:- start:1551 stop:1910 length:360 start_codon:yes stop_codon:yes gene_type:complete
MITGTQKKILMDVDESGNLRVDADFVEMYYKEKEQNYKLIRERDKLTRFSSGVVWIEWNEDGTFKEQFKEVMIGRSLLMSPFNSGFTWQTTEVIEIIEQREDYIKFKTKNSNYELFKIK